MNARQQWIAFMTLLTKEVKRFTRIWIQTVLPPAIMTMLYFIIFGKLIGSQIGDMDGYSYMDYIVPGLILMSVITNSYSNVVSSLYSSKFQHHIEELLVSPMSSWMILAGYVAGGVARGISVGIAVTLVAMLFSDFQVAHIGLTLLVFIFTAILFSIAGFINAIFANSFDDISIVPTFVLTPLTYLGGIFYSIRMLPEFWQQVSLANPVLYMINAFRYGILGVSDINPAVAVALIMAFVLILGSFALWLLKAGVGIKT